MRGRRTARNSGRVCDRRERGRVFPLGRDLRYRGGDCKGNNWSAHALRSTWHGKRSGNTVLHHDLWDYDLGTGRSCDGEANGKRSYLAQATKFGCGCVQSRNGTAIWPSRKTVRERRARAVVADAAVSHKTGAVLEAEVHRGRCKPVSRRGRARAHHRHPAELAQRRYLHAAQHHEEPDFRARRAWRSELGRCGRGSRDRHVVCALGRSAGPAHTAAARRVERRDRQDGAAAALHRTARIDVLRRQRHERDEPAVGPADRLRFEYGRYQMESAARRGPRTRGEGDYRHGQQLSRPPQRSGCHRRRGDFHGPLRRSHGSCVRQRQRKDPVGKEDDSELRGHSGCV